MLLLRTHAPSSAAVHPLGGAVTGGAWLLCLLRQHAYVTIPLTQTKLGQGSGRYTSLGPVLPSLVSVPHLALATSALGWFYRTTRALSKYFFIKLRYKGKSFRWHRRKAALVLRFGRSHLALAQPPLYVR